ncbi:MAG: PQQ-binding-like beta-propeller repeat protein [Chitinophagaceae bacterium]|nr:PQQ-binding-like beta-propeller repeat protein [Chitinophagaceae bacterium]
MKQINKFLNKHSANLTVLLLLVAQQSVGQQEFSAENWGTFNRNYNGDRYSPLTQITKANVGGLKLLHTFDLGNDVASFQTGPVVIDGIMYFTTDTITYAINAATGALKWKKIRPVKDPRGMGANRGVAYYKGVVFRGASDAHVIAMNASDGKIIWDIAIDEATIPGVSIPMAPIAWNGLLFIGHAGGDNVGITGHVYALDVNDGHVVWKFSSVPDSGPARSTWPSAANGVVITGGAFWTNFTLDTKNGILYIPAGNPAPDLDTEVRQGDNLYSNCVIALDTKSGKMLGYIQVVKRDSHDWDVSAAPVLITTKNGRHIIASANKDGLLSVIDRGVLTTGSNSTLDSSKTLSFIYAVPTTVRENMDVPLSREVFTHFKPGLSGGSEWNGAAYNPQLDMIYTGTNDWGISVKLLPIDSARMVPGPGMIWFDGTLIIDSISEARGWLSAFHAKDGSTAWKFKSPAPILAGVTPTAAGLVFAASLNGDVYGFDASTGKLLWKTSTQLPNGGGVISYSVNGKQFIAVAAGMKSALWPYPSKANRMLIYGL